MRITLFVQIAFGFCCILLAAPVAAQKEQIALPFAAKPGETFKVRVTTTDLRTSGGALRLHTVRTGAYDGRVLEAAAAGYTISWALKSFENRIIEDKAGEAAAKAQLSGDLVAKVFQDVPVVFETNAAGLPIRVREWQPLATRLANSMRAQLGKALKERFSAAPSGKSQAEAEKAIEAQVDQMIKALILRHDERTATALFQEALLLGGVQHRELPLGKPVEGAGLAPALVSDGQIPFTTKVTLASAERAKGFAVVTWRSDYDANQLKAPMFELLRSQLKAAGVTDESKIREALKPVEAMRLSRVDTGEARIDMKDGWAKQLEFVKVISTEATQSAPDVRETKMVIEVSKP